MDRVLYHRGVRFRVGAEIAGMGDWLIYPGYPTCFCRPDKIRS